MAGTKPVPLVGALCGCGITVLHFHNLTHELLTMPLAA